MKTLLWKEWKEMWWLWLGVIVSLLLFMRLAEYENHSNSNWSALWQLLVIGLGILYCGFTGAHAFAGEREKGSYPYLLTRPFHPSSILWVKYILGFLQIATIFFALIITLVYRDHPYLYPDFLKRVIEILSAPELWFIFSILISFYTLCFFISLFVGDTIRSFLIGFSIVLVFWGWIIYLEAYKHSNLGLNELWVVKYGLYFPPGFILFLGIMGIVYLSILRKRFVWKTMSLFLLLLAFLLYYFNNNLLYGNMRPVGMIGKTQLLDSYDSLYDGYQMFYSKNKVYTFDYGSNRDVHQLRIIDVENPSHPKNKPFFKLPQYTWNPEFDDDKLYTIWGNSHPSIRKANPEELVIYDLHQGENPNVIKRIPLPTLERDTVLNRTIPIPFIRISEHYVYVQYGIATGWEYRDTFYHLTTKQAYELSTTSITKPKRGVTHGEFALPYQPISKQYSYKRHVLQFDKINYQLLNEFDIAYSKSLPEPIFSFWYSRFSSEYYLTQWDNTTAPSVINIYSSSDTTYSSKLSSLTWAGVFTDRVPPTGELLSFQVKGKYLYALTRDHPLEIYDLTDGKHPRLLSVSDWNWLDKAIFKNNGNDPQQRSVFVKGNLVTIRYERGLVFYDVSNPTHPRVIGTLFSEKMDFANEHDGYLYNYGPKYGFSIFQLPKVKS